MCHEGSTVYMNLIVVPYIAQRHYNWSSHVASSSSSAPPSAVQGLSTTAGNTTFVVRWNAPLSNGGRSDTYYVVKYREVGNLAFSTAGRTDGLSFTVRGLNPVTRYMFRITAENGVSDQEPGSVGDRTSQAVDFTEVGGKLQPLAPPRRIEPPLGA